MSQARARLKSAFDIDSTIIFGEFCQFLALKPFSAAAAAVIRKHQPKMAIKQSFLYQAARGAAAAAARRRQLVRSVRPSCRSSLDAGAGVVRSVGGGSSCVERLRTPTLRLAVGRSVMRRRPARSVRRRYCAVRSVVARLRCKIIPADIRKRGPEQLVRPVPPRRWGLPLPGGAGLLGPQRLLSEVALLAGQPRRKFFSTSLSSAKPITVLVDSKASNYNTNSPGFGTHQRPGPGRTTT